MLVTSIFSFCHSVSTLSKREIVIIVTLNLLSAIAFNLVASKNLSFGKGLNAKHFDKYIACNNCSFFPETESEGVSEIIQRLGCRTGKRGESMFSE